VRHAPLYKVGTRVRRTPGGEPHEILVSNECRIRLRPMNGEEVTIRERKAFDISPHTELEVLSCE